MTRRVYRGRTIQVIARLRPHPRPGRSARIRPEFLRCLSCAKPGATKMWAAERGSDKLGECLCRSALCSAVHAARDVGPKCRARSVAILAPFRRIDGFRASSRRVGTGSCVSAGRPCRRRKSRRSTPPSSLSSGGAPSARTGRAARWRRRGIRAGRSRSTWRRSTAASGRRPTRAARGTRSSTTSRPVRSASSRSRRPIPTSSTSAAAKACIVRISRPATASTSRPTPAGPGHISA